MHTHSNDQRGYLAPMTVAVLIAVVGAITLFFTEFGPHHDIERNGVSMIAASVADRAGATATPSEPLTQSAERKTSVVSR